MFCKVGEAQLPCDTAVYRPENTHIAPGIFFIPGDMCGFLSGDSQMGSGMAVCRRIIAALLCHSADLYCSRLFDGEFATVVSASGAYCVVDVP